MVAAGPRPPHCLPQRLGGPMHALPVRVRSYVAAVTIVASVFVVAAIVATVNDPGMDLIAIASLAALYSLADAATTRGSRDDASLALSSVVMISAIPLVGLWGSVLVALPSLLFRPEREPAIKRIFNTSQLIVAAGLACLSFYAVGGSVGVTPNVLPELLWQVLVADVVHLVVNGLLVAMVIALDRRVTVRSILTGTMSEQAVSYLGYGLFGLFWRCFGTVWVLGPSRRCLCFSRYMLHVGHTPSMRSSRPAP